jgi:Holliday junction resolvasome RuvABC endonuclease subunit
MVQSLLQLRTPEELAVVAKEDAADAMAVAICHANQLTIRLKMGVAS